MSQVGPAEWPWSALRGERVVPRLTFTLCSAQLSSGPNRWGRKLLVFPTSISGLVTQSAGQSEEPNRSLNPSGSQSALWTKGEGKEFNCPNTWKIFYHFQGATTHHNVFDVVLGYVNHSNQEHSLCFYVANIDFLCREKILSNYKKRTKEKSRRFGSLTSSSPSPKWINDHQKATGLKWIHPIYLFVTPQVGNNLHSNELGNSY